MHTHEPVRLCTHMYAQGAVALLLPVHTHQQLRHRLPTHFIFSASCSVFSRMAWDSWDTGFSIRLSKITWEGLVSA